jgi:hypothetical protein
MTDDTRMGHRFDAFCVEYDIPEKHHGSLRMLAAMAFVLGFEIEVRLHPRGEEEKNDD